MSEQSLEAIYDDQYLNKLAQNLINSFYANGSSYNTIKNILDEALNKHIDIAISILQNDFDDYSFQNQLNSLKILPFRRLFEEIINYKKNPSLTFNKPVITRKVEPIVIQDHENKIVTIPRSVFTTARQSKSSKIQSFLDSIDLNNSNNYVDKIKELITLLIQESENETQLRMANLLSNVRKIVGVHEEVEKSISVDKSEKQILKTVQTLKDKVTEITQKSIKTNTTQLQLIKTFQSQIEDLRSALQFKNDTQAFENEIIKYFENIQNSLNTSKYDELFENYKKAFKKIEEITASKNEVLVRNGKLETQILLVQQKNEELMEEIAKLKEKISLRSPKSPKSP